MPSAASFIGGSKGSWKVVDIKKITGPTLGRVQMLEVVAGLIPQTVPGAGWLLRGVTSNERYTTLREHQSLEELQSGLGRAQATSAALIPIKKSASWWALSQDQRRRIFETRSHHIRTGMKYLPAIARRLYHSRDLGEAFDFLTWFEYEPSSERRFDELLGKLRETEEWTYVKREVDVRLVLDTAPVRGLARAAHPPNRA